MNKFTFVSYNGKTTLKGNIFDGANDFARGYGKASISLAKIAEYCMINGIDIGLCVDINEIRYFPHSAGSMGTAFSDMVDSLITMHGYGKNNTNAIIIINSFGTIFGGLEESGFRVYIMPNGLSMYIHMNKFTENLLDHHFNEIFNDMNCAVEVNYDEE